jgi:arsenate reductase
MTGLPRSDAEIVLLHNPRCSKSRAAKDLLEARGIRFAERRYLEAPLSLDELRDLAARIGRPPSEWVRAGEPAYADAGLGAGSDADAILRAIAAHPALLERPVLVRGGRAVVGRPPERIGALLD